MNLLNMQITGLLIGTLFSGHLTAGNQPKTNVRSGQSQKQYAALNSLRQHRQEQQKEGVTPQLNYRGRTNTLKQELEENQSAVNTRAGLTLNNNNRLGYAVRINQTVNRVRRNREADRLGVGELEQYNAEVLRFNRNHTGINSVSQEVTSG